MAGKLMGFLIISGFVFFASLGSAQAHWELDGEQSSISFVSIKANDVGESHSFRKVSGQIDDDGNAVIEIDLASVDTLIDLRDERMINFLFEATTYPTATLRATVDPQEFAALEHGARLETFVEAEIDLHGISDALEADIAVVRLDEGTVQVTSTRPVILDAGSFGLTAGVNKLRELASLDAISLAVPVTFQLTFTQH